MDEAHPDRVNKYIQRSLWIKAVAMSGRSEGDTFFCTNQRNTVEILHGPEVAGCCERISIDNNEGVLELPEGSHCGGNGCLDNVMVR